MANVGGTLFFGAYDWFNGNELWKATQVPPIAAPAGPYTLREGASLSLDASGSYSTVAGASIAAYSWDLNGDDVFGDATGVSPTLTWSQLQALGVTSASANVPVKVRVTDDGGDSATAATTLTVLARHVATASIENIQLRNYLSSGAGSLLAGVGSGLTSPISAVYDSSGNLYVADFLTQQIAKFSPSGVKTVFAGIAQGVVTPTVLAIDGANNLYVANYLVGNVLKITPAGASSVLASAADGLDRPFDVAVDGAGNVYATGLEAQKVWKIASPHLVSVFGDTTDSLLAPISVAVDAASNVYVSDFLLGGIRKFTAAHADATFVAPGGVPAPTDLAFDPVTGNLYVAEYLAANKIAVVTPAGAVSTFVSAGQGVSLPFGVAIGYYAAPPPSPTPSPPPPSLMPSPAPSAPTRAAPSAPASALPARSGAALLESATSKQSLSIAAADAVFALDARRKPLPRALEATLARLAHATHAAHEPAAATESHRAVDLILRRVREWR